MAITCKHVYIQHVHVHCICTVCNDENHHKNYMQYVHECTLYSEINYWDEPEQAQTLGLYVHHF